MKKKPAKPRPVTAWAWKIKDEKDASGWGLCYYAASSHASLIEDGRPSPEAKAVRVKLSEI